MGTFIGIIIAVPLVVIIGLVVCVIVLFRKVIAVQDHARWENKRYDALMTIKTESLEKRLYLLAEECGFTFMWLEDAPSRWRVIPNTSAEQHVTMSCHYHSICPDGCKSDTQKPWNT